MGKIIGIDLGTTNSVVAVMMGSEPIVIPSTEGERLIPSVVAVNKNGERLVGRVARNQSIINAENTIFSVKRFMGSEFKDELAQSTLQRVPYHVSPGGNGGILIRMGGKEYAPPEISAMILAKIKRDAESYLGETVSQAVITVPAYFNDAQRNATKDAGKIAGLDVLRIINEPTASSLAYGLDKNANHTILVYDLGGGTFDVSILEVGDGIFEVKSTSGDTFLGGDDFDQRIMEYLADEFERENKIDLRKDPQALQRLKDAAEKTKIELTSTLQADIHLPYVVADASGPKHLSVSLTRAKLEQLTADLVAKTLDPIRQALADASLTPAQIDEIVLVGGMTRMPAIQELVRGFFGKELHKGVNPDEVVAIGAAIQAGVLAGDVSDVLLLDVTPLTLSIETMGGVATPLIPRNTAIPTRVVDTFSTALDNQPQVEVHIVQGERPLAADNKGLGKLILDGIQPAPRGIPQIEVTFDIDANGILKVTARDKHTGRTQHISLAASSGLSNEEIEQMRRDAQSHAAEDRRKRERIESQNQADSMIHAASEFLKRPGTTISVENRSRVEKAVEMLQQALAGDDTAVIKQQVEALQLVMKSAGDDSSPSSQPPRGFDPPKTKILD
ncbi:MAG: molecular chaperone DnaK [Anaerolineales bacterium]